MDGAACPRGAHAHGRERREDAHVPCARPMPRAQAQRAWEGIEDEEDGWGGGTASDEEEGGVALVDQLVLAPLEEVAQLLLAGSKGQGRGCHRERGDQQGLAALDLQIQEVAGRGRDCINPWKILRILALVQILSKAPGRPRPGGGGRTCGRVRHICDTSRIIFFFSFSMYGAYLDRSRQQSAPAHTTPATAAPRW